MKCLATGLSAQLSLYPDGGCKGSVSQLAGSGTETVCKMTGSWNDRVVAETVGQVRVVHCFPVVSFLVNQLIVVA